MLTRREFLVHAILFCGSRQQRAQRPVRIAMVTTVYKYLSHGQHIGDRFLVGYPNNGDLAQAEGQFVSSTSIRSLKVT